MYFCTLIKKLYQVLFHFTITNVHIFGDKNLLHHKKLTFHLS